MILRGGGGIVANWGQRDGESFSPQRDAQRRREGKDNLGIRGVAAAGASRTYRRAYPAANSLNRTLVAVGYRLDGLTFLRVLSMLDSRISSGATITAIRSP